MNIRDSFPSKYVKSSDIPEGSQVKVTMDRVEIENVAGDSNPDNDKPVVYFVGKQKGLVLNKTNANAISATYGDDTDAWHGQQIALYVVETSFQGKPMPGIRVRVPKPANGAAAAVARPPTRQPVRQPAGGPFDDVIDDDPNQLPPDADSFD